MAATGLTAFFANARSYSLVPPCRQRQALGISAMDAADLGIFAAPARRRSMNRAGAELNMTQSDVTGRIKLLEAHAGKGALALPRFLCAYRRRKGAGHGREDAQERGAADRNPL